MFGKWFPDNFKNILINGPRVPFVLLIPPVYFSLVVVSLHLMDRIGILLARLSMGLVHCLWLVILLFLTGWMVKRKGLRGLGHTFLGLREHYSLASVFLLFAPVVAGLTFWWMAYHGLYKASITPPHNHDAANHVFMVRRILETGTINYSEVFYYSLLNSWYPMGQHVFIASVLSTLGDASLLQTVYPMVLHIGSFFPWAVFCLAEAVGVKRRLAAGASILSLTMFLYPFNVLSWGGFGMLIGIVLLTYLLALTIYFLRQPTRLVFFLVWLVAITIFLTHTSEIFSYVLMLIPILITFPVRQKIFGKYVKLGTALLVFSIFLVWPFLSQAAGRVGLINLIKTQPHYPASAIWTYFDLYFLTINGNYVFNALALLGIIGSFKKPRLRVVGLFFLMILGVWLIRFMSPALDGIFMKTFPWLEYERIAYLFAIPYALAAAWGLDLVLRKVFSVVFRNNRANWIYGITYGAIMLGFGMPILSHSYKNLAVFVRNYSATTSEDIRLMRLTADRCSTYLIEPQDDAGRWIPYVTGKKVLFDGVPDLYHDYEARVEQVKAVQLEVTWQRVRELEADYPFDCVFYGNKRVLEHKARLSLPRLMTNGNLKVLAQEGGAYVFVKTDSADTAEIVTIQPLTVEAEDEEVFSQHVEGGIGPLNRDEAGSSYRLVSTVMDIWVREPYEVVSITAQAAFGQELACDTYINEVLHRSVLILPDLTEVELAQLEGKAEQTRVRLVCPAKDERALQAIEAVSDAKKLQVVGAHFAITSVKLK